MAIDFKFFDDSGLVGISNTTLTQECQSDLSDGEHEYTYYFGSTAASQQLQTTVSPGVNNITITPTYILPTWEASTSYSLGDSVIPTTPNGYRYQVTTGGTSGASEPTWGVTLNGTTNDNTVTWTLVAEDSPTTEIILALDSADLDTNTPGAALSLGNTVLSGVINAVPIYIRLTNTITAVSESLGTPELGLLLNSVQQTSV